MLDDIDINSIPVEVVSNILSFLPTVECVHVAGTVCKKWRQAAKNDMLWSYFLRKDFLKKSAENSFEVYKSAKLTLQEKIKKNAVDSLKRKIKKILLDILKLFTWGIFASMLTAIILKLFVFTLNGNIKIPYSLFSLPWSFIFIIILIQESLYFFFFFYLIIFLFFYSFRY
jgi:hypothetical protein